MKLIKGGYVHALSLYKITLTILHVFFKSVTYYQPYENGDNFKYILFKSTNYLLQWVHVCYKNFHATKIYMEICSLLLYGTLFSNTTEKAEGRTFFTQTLLSAFPLSFANDVTEFDATCRKQRLLPPPAKLSDISLTCFWVAKLFVRSHSILCYSGHWLLQIILALFN